MATAFTPVNTLPAGEQISGNPSQAASGPFPPESGDSRIVEQGAISAVSDYLGRGDHSRSTQAAIAPKKHASRGRKRVSPVQAQPHVKRRKVSDINASMPVTKAPAKKREAAVCPLDSATVVASDGAGKFRLVLSPKLSGQASEKVTTGTISSKPVAVYASPTSMTAYNASGQQTSVETLKAGAGRTKTLYRRVPTLGFPQSNASFTQPFLIQSESSRDRDATQIRSRALLPTLDSSPTKPEQTNTAVYASTGSKRAFSNLDAEDQAPRQPRRISEDMFSGDDIDDVEMLALAGEAETNLYNRVDSQQSAVVHQLPTPDNSDAVVGLDTELDCISQKRQSTPILGPEEDFPAADEYEYVEHPESYETISTETSTLVTRERRLNIRAVSADENYGGWIYSGAELKVLGIISKRTPVLPFPCLLPTDFTTEDSKSSGAHDGRKPIVRQPFPTSILDRSPILGASNNTLLRVCFRVGEALKEGSQAYRCNRNIIIELYARVTWSARDGRKQHFIFKDLYHDNPPHLEGTFELWQQSSLWKLDSDAFLVPREGGVMCRVIARMRMVEAKWRLQVLSVWEAGWDDVDLAAGIHAKMPE